MELKVGPKKILTILEGLKYHSDTFLKMMFMLYGLIIFCATTAYLPRLIAGNKIETTQNLLLALVCITFFTSVGICFLVFRYAQKDAYSWFRVSNDEIVLLLKKGDNLIIVEKIPFKKIKLLIVGRGNVFYRPKKNTSNEYLSLKIRYQSVKNNSDLDSIADLGFRTKNEIDYIYNSIRVKSQNLKLVS